MFMGAAFSTLPVDLAGKLRNVLLGPIHAAHINPNIKVFPVTYTS
jgi:hypothetical protein